MGDDTIANLTNRLRQARAQILEAESELDDAIGAIETLTRAQKVAASTDVSKAFEKLRSTKARLEELEALLREE
jgi:hypothetical protein